MATITCNKGEQVEFGVKLSHPEIDFQSGDVQLKIGTVGQAALVSKTTAWQTATGQAEGLYLHGDRAHVTIYTAENVIAAGSYVGQLWLRSHHVLGDRLLVEFTYKVNDVVV